MEDMVLFGCEYYEMANSASVVEREIKLDIEIRLGVANIHFVRQKVKI
jgi:hypothetical protein